MLMVIFGAGASYDSVPSRPPNRYPPRQIDYRRPPLANELFEDRPRFVEVMSQFPRCQPVIPHLQNLPKDGSVERVLEGLQAEAERYPERHRQLAAIRYYLHFMMRECEQFWKEIARGVTNYKTLLDQIEKTRKLQERVCLVTFNYDRMIEEDLSTVGVEIRALPDYIANRHYKLIKLHGSVNWAREVDTTIDNVGQRNVWDIGRELIDRAADINISQRYRLVTERPIGRVDQIPLFPAIAIPVESKREYECPAEHLEVLRTFIPEVTKLLIIGWRAMEVPFRQLLAGNLRQGVSVMVVSGDQEKAHEVVQTLVRAGIIGDFFLAKGGFTEFIINREADEFLKS